MTRKELLAARANEVVEVALSHGACLSEAECTIVRDAVLYELMRVEREVWEKAARLVEDGRFISDYSMEYVWARQVAAVLRKQQELA